MVKISWEEKTSFFSVSFNNLIKIKCKQPNTFIALHQNARLKKTIDITDKMINIQMRPLKCNYLEQRNRRKLFT